MKKHRKEKPVNMTSLRNSRRIISTHIIQNASTRFVAGCQGYSFNDEDNNKDQCLDKSHWFEFEVREQNEKEFFDKVALRLLILSRLIILVVIETMDIICSIILKLDVAMVLRSSIIWLVLFLVRGW